MSYDLSLFDSAAAERERDIAITRVGLAAPVEWKVAAMHAVENCCRQNELFIVDAVWKYLTEKPPEARAMGAIIQAARRLGYCEPTKEFQPSAQRQCHARPQRVWRSLLFTGSPTT